MRERHRQAGGQRVPKTADVEASEKTKFLSSVRIHKVVGKNGEILVKGLPCKEGQRVEMVVLFEPSSVPGCDPLTSRRLLNSGLIGLWKDRRDIKDSAVYARQLREQAQCRRE